MAFDGASNDTLRIVGTHFDERIVVRSPRKHDKEVRLLQLLAPTTQNVQKFAPNACMFKRRNAFDARNYKLQFESSFDGAPHGYKDDELAAMFASAFALSETRAFCTEEGLSAFNLDSTVRRHSGALSCQAEYAVSLAPFRNSATLTKS